MNICIRKFENDDTEKLVELLKLNNQYSHPDVEGPESMQRVAACEAAVFLVALVNDNVCGCIKAIYDGSRALVDLLSIHPDYQGLGLGTRLFDETVKEFKNLGATTISVTVTEESSSFWAKKGFERLPVFLMLKDLNSD